MVFSLRVSLNRHLPHRVSLNPGIKASILNIRSCLSSFGYRVHTYSGRNLKELSSTELEATVVSLTLNDINRVLYRADPEEKDDGKGYGAYSVPGYGNLVYCGLQGTGHGETDLLTWGSD